MSDLHRVGLVVHYGDANYGNQLVNLAARRVLEQCGCAVDVIAFVGGDAELRRASLRRLPAKVARLVKDGTLGPRLRGQIRRRLSGPEAVDEEVANLRRARREKFAQFATTTLHPRFVDVAERFALASEYDEFVVGSDQIWNFDYRLGPWLFLDFAEPSRRSCLAPSIGHQELPEEWVGFYRNWLSGFHEISVRESHWVGEFGRLFPGLTVSALIDPTLVLSQEDWAGVARTPAPRPRYVLVYELGELSRSHWDFVETVAAANGLEVVHLSERSVSPVWNSDPADLLGLIQSAALVVIDSFHGSVFSFLFDRPVVIVRREGFAASMNGQIDTLVERLVLGDRVFPHLAPDEVLHHDYASGRARLTEYQSQFWAYLSRQGLPTPSSESEVAS